MYTIEEMEEILGMPREQVVEMFDTDTHAAPLTMPVETILGIERGTFIMLAGSAVLYFLLIALF